MAIVAVRDEVTELLQELIRLDTTNPPGNETAAAELLRAYLEESGAECELYARVPERATITLSRHSSSSSPVFSIVAAMRSSCARASSAARRTALPMW